VGGLLQERLDPLGEGRWAALLRGTSSAGPFHHPLWLELLHEQYGYGIEAVGVCDDTGRLVAGLPLARVRSRLTGERLVALPFSDLCPPVVADDAPYEAVPLLAGALAELQREEELDLELRAQLPGLAGSLPGRPFLHHVLALQGGAEAVERGYAKSQIGRGVRKARKEGVTIEFRTDRAALDDFYRLHVATRRHQGVPTQPKRFIRRFEKLFDAGLGWVARARADDTTIAAAVFLSWGGTVVYKYGASDRAQLGKRPNNLLFAEAIRRACDEGAHTLDFGRTDLGNEGLAAFKRGWGAEERPLSYTRLGRGSREEENGAAAGVPAPVQALIGHSPRFVGRLIGEALYRHYG
jgi:CelD/BcsL family acetyltransferase involved in cellulose biosynthesis